ncbi:MAG: aspartate--tRNA ligase [Rhodobacteraceae bacterium]|nr:MAG: aspartate--tRNA ligase [Paracoccaceae bacterium]|tara:strand:- start:1530 stop:3323 length:1794 start_codon:yes stop_codon:yes gene_type:complete
MKVYRTHNCAELNLDHVDQQVTLSGWIHRVRDHGGVLFIDLRDHYGITQVVIDPDSNDFGTAETYRSEWCIQVKGRVKAREPELINKNLQTGYIEVFIDNTEIISTAEDLPLPVFGELEYPEETRLRYRFLDLRREGLHKNMMLRANVIASIRKEMWEIGFNEFQTPILTASSPEGARDFLVPSRLNRGKFYALPQAPQQFKQLIMMGGFDKYFQIAPCFRDEDPRSDRSPTDFYQLDIEMSFVNQDDVFDTVKPVIERIFKEYSQKKVESHWPRITYKDSMLWYGTDKPDLRNPIKMKKVCEYFKDAGFAVFSNILKNEGSEIRAIPAPGGGSRNFCDRMNNFAQKEGLPGMGYIFWREADGDIDAAGPLAKNIGFEKSEMIRESLGLKVGDAAFFLGGEPKNFEAFSAKARNQIGAQLKLIDEGVFAFAWIIDFPMYEKDTENDKIDFSHNPFSMPQGGLPALNGNPLEVLGYQYDLACNGYELLSGAIRNHEIDTMFKAFELAGYSNAEVSSRFSGMIQGLKFAPPPHGGCALGIDRMLMLLADEENIREVIMFPMNQKGEDLMMNAPSLLTKAQIHELGIRIIEEDVNKVGGS